MVIFHTYVKLPEGSQFCCFITVTSVESTSTFMVVVRRIYFLHFPPIMQKAVFHLDLPLAIPFSILHDVLLTLWWTNSLQLKMAMEIVDFPWFSHEKWWFSIAMSLFPRGYTLLTEASWVGTRFSAPAAAGGHFFHASISVELEALREGTMGPWRWMDVDGDQIQEQGLKPRFSGWFRFR